MKIAYIEIIYPNHCGECRFCHYSSIRGGFTCGATETNEKIKLNNHENINNNTKPKFCPLKYYEI